MNIEDNEVVIDGNVYNLEAFTNVHPGGRQMLNIFGGKDATVHYFMLHQHLKLQEKHLLLHKVRKLHNKSDEYIVNSEAFQDLKKRIKKSVPYTFATSEWYIKAVCIMGLNIYLELSNIFYGFSTIKSICLGINMAMIGLCIQHDANHGAVSAKPWVNILWGYTQDWIGGSSLLWKHHHVLLHHAYTNVNDEDPDASSDLIRLHKLISWKSQYKYQQFYIWFLLPLLPLKWHFAEIWDLYSMEHMDVGISSMALNEARFSILLRILFIIRFYIIPLWVYPSIFTLAYILLALGVGGLYLGFNFIISHNFLDVTNVVEKNKDWAILQVETSSTVGGRALGFFHGGLNYQIEHHLFPRISHVHYWKIKPIVQEWCKDYGIKYTHFDNIWHNLVSCYKYMRIMGAKSDE